MDTNPRYLREWGQPADLERKYPAPSSSLRDRHGYDYRIPDGRTYSTDPERRASDSSAARRALRTSDDVLAWRLQRRNSHTTRVPSVRISNENIATSISVVINGSLMGPATDKWGNEREHEHKLRDPYSQNRARRRSD